MIELDVYQNKLLKIFHFETFCFVLFLRYQNHDAILLFEGLTCSTFYLPALPFPTLAIEYIKYIVLIYT